MDTSTATRTSPRRGPPRLESPDEVRRGGFCNQRKKRALPDDEQQTSAETSQEPPPKKRKHRESGVKDEQCDEKKQNGTSCVERKGGHSDTELKRRMDKALALVQNMCSGEQMTPVIALSYFAMQRRDMRSDESQIATHIAEVFHLSKELVLRHLSEFEKANEKDNVITDQKTQ